MSRLSLIKRVQFSGKLQSVFLNPFLGAGEELNFIHCNTTIFTSKSNDHGAELYDSH